MCFPFVENLAVFSIYKKVSICISIFKHFCREYSLKKSCQVIGMLFIYSFMLLMFYPSKNFEEVFKNIMSFPSISHWHLRNDTI